MSTIDAHALIEEFGSRNVELWVDGGQLRYRAPQGTMTPELKTLLAANKHAVISSLDARAARGAAGSGEPFALTELQHAYFLGHAAFAELGSLAAQIYLEFDFEALDFERLAEVVQRLIVRHDALRVVVLRDGHQRVLSAAPPFRLERLDLRGQSPVEIAAARLRTRQQLSTEAVDPFAGRPFAATVHEADGATTVFVCVSLLVLDGTSLRILLEEGLRLYADLDATLPPLRLSYRGYVEAVAEARRSPAYAASLAYWRGRLPELPGAPQLPLVGTTSTRPDRFTRRVKRLSPDAWHRFKIYCQQAGATPSAALCAAFATVIATWSRHPRFVLNVMHLNRPPLHPDAARVVGNFASTTLLDVDLAQAGSLVQRARQVQRQLLGDLEHAAVSGMVVARELNLAEQASPRPRAPVVFASALNQSGAERLGWLDRLTFGALHTPHVWLDHQVLEDGGTVVFNWDAVEELFPAGMLDDAFAAYGAWIDRLATGALAWHETPCLVPPAHRALVAEVNRTARPFASATLPELVNATCARTPDAVAVIAEERRLTYGELAGEAEAVAAWLRRCGARSGGLVAVVMEKGWEQVVAVLGVLQAGAAYLPVDPSLPAERIRFLLAQCEPGLALTQRRVDRAVAWPASFARLCVDEELPREGAPHTGSPPSVEDLAYVIFTSGSTGTPKGVMISHRGAVNTILDVNERFAVGPRDRVLALSSLSFDLSVYDLFGPLAAGGAIVLPPSSDSRDPARWLELSRRERVTVWNSVPALAQLLVEYVEGHGETIGETLRLVLMSGDWIPVGLPDALRARAPRACVMSLGGATEASIWSILHPTDRLAPGAPSIPYGKAMANQRVYVLDDTLAPRPVWVPGEIYIGGDGVADGYFRDPERTAERFVRSPRTGERLYRTGDIGRLLPDGAIEFLGREDAQVKVQGFRIELGEIERALERAPGVRAAVVVPVGERHGAKSLIAYVVPADASARPDADDLRRSVAATLPAYMVPTRLLFVEGLPLTANGKVDRGALARFDAGERPAFVAPRNPAEAALAALWSEVLGVERIGVHDDFFALGGHSLLAVRLGALIAARSRRELSIGALLSHPTLAAQAALLRQSDIDAEPRNLVCLAPADADSPDRPIVLVHPVGGNVVCYRELAGLLRRCGAVYGIQSSDAEEGPTSLPEMAQRYVAALREAQPRGPYRLGGWSLGGFVAMEMARLLHAAGDDIELLFVIDSRMPSASAAVDRAQLLARFVGDLCGGTIPSSTALLAQLRSVADKEAIAEAHRVALAAGILPGELSPEAFARMYRLFERNARALLVYRPPRCELLVHAFCAETVLPGYDDALGWEASRRAVHRAAGDHYGVMRSPSLERIAATLREALASTHDRAG